MRRRVSIAALCLAWLCANGVIWNGVQAVAWAKMFRDYARVMPLAQALKLTFDGTAPCDLCEITEKARDSERQRLPHEAALGGTEKLVLAFHPVPSVILAAPDSTWPAIGDITGPGRTEPVPLPPPRV